MIQRISIIGAGKVATHLGKRLHDCGLDIQQVYSRRLSDAETLAYQLDAEDINNWSLLNTEKLDLLILAVRDQAIPEVVQHIKSLLSPSTLVVHTSGTSPLHWLSDHLPRAGIFYPLQSFSPGRAPDFSQIPLCIEASNVEDQQHLFELGQRISHKVQITSEADRRTLHLAAVFVNNFVNHLYQIGTEILAEKDLSFDLLLSLIQETAAKIQDQNPAAMQTGPAIRRDEMTIQRQTELLENYPDWQQLYLLMTRLIQS